jgi:uncharacterized OB-fold protein
MAEAVKFAHLAPTPTPETRPFWEGAKRHELMLPRCKACGKCHFYPRGICPHCWSNDLEWIKASGKGKLHTFAIPQRSIMGIPGPFITAIVELAEGPRIATNIVGVDPDPKNLRCDMEVEVVFDDLTDTISLPKFRPTKTT